MQKEYEELLRGLLTLPNKPALVSMELVGLVFDHLSTGADQVSSNIGHSRALVYRLMSFSLQHMGVAQYYDVPIVSIRSLILPLIFRDDEVAQRFFVSGNQEQPDGTFKHHVDTRHVGSFTGL